MFRKYHWKNAILQRKAKTYDRLMLVCAVLAAIIWFFALNIPLLVLAVVVFGVFIFALLSWRVQGQDKRITLKPKR